MRLIKSRKDILNGNIAQQILIISIPIIGSYLLQQLYQFVDSIVLGRYAGVEALAAVGGSASMVNNIILNIASGIATGVMIVVAQNYGVGNSDKVKNAVRTGIFIAFVFGGFITVLSISLAKPILLLMKCPSDTLLYSQIYMSWNFVGLIPYTIFQIGDRVLQASGNSRRSLFFTIVIAITKISLDFILVGLFKMGVFGVSIATFVSYLVCGIIVLVIFNRSIDSYHFEIKDFGFDLESLKSIFKIGVPIAIQSAIFALTNALVSVKINEQGTNSIAAFSIYNTIDNFYWCFNNGLGAAIITIVGQNYGNHNMKRVKESLKYGVIIQLFVTIAISTTLFFFGRDISSFLTSNVDVLDKSTSMIKVTALCYVFFILVEMISGTIKGCGDSVASMIISFIGICVVRFVYVLLFDFTNATQVILCYPISWVITSIIYLLYFLINKKYRTPKNNL